MTRSALFLGSILSTMALAGCFSEGSGDRALVGASANPGGVQTGPWIIDEPAPPEQTPDAPPPEAPSPIRIADVDRMVELEPLAVTELASFFPESARLVGVVTDQATGRTHVLEARTGLYELTDDGARLVFDLPESRVVAGTGDGSPPVELTDVGIDHYNVGPDGSPSLVLTAENDGFLLSLPSTTLRSHFCYLPPVTDWNVTSSPSVSQELREQGIPIVERTEAVAVNASSGQIFAQPRTQRMDSGGVAGSELFVFDTSGGQPIGTRRFERTDFVAGGAAFLFQISLILGSGNHLYFTQGWADDVRRIASVPGVAEITGMTNAASGNLLVLDGPNKRLIELDTAAIGDAANAF